METQRIVNLLNNSDNVINDQNNTVYCEGNENGSRIKFETKVIKSNLCDYSDAYIPTLMLILMQTLMLHLKTVLHLQEA